MVFVDSPCSKLFTDVNLIISVVAVKTLCVLYTVRLQLSRKACFSTVEYCQGSQRDGIVRDDIYLG